MGKLHIIHKTQVICGTKFLFYKISRSVIFFLTAYSLPEFLLYLTQISLFYDSMMIKE